MKETFKKFRSRSRAPIIWVIGPLMAGYIVARWVKMAEVLLLSIGLSLALIWGICWWVNCKKKFCLAFGVLSIFLLSWSYMLICLPTHLEWKDRPPREAYLSLKIDQLSSFGNKYGLKAGYAEIVNTPNHLQEITGQKIYFLLNVEKECEALIRGAIIEVKGILSGIRKDSQNGFDHYLSSQGINFKLHKGRFLKLQSSAPNFYQFCARQNQRMIKILERGSDGTNYSSSIYKAMLLGDQASLSEKQKFAFQVTGSLHLFSISGLHVGVIAGCLAFLLYLIKIKNPWAAIIGISFLFLYVQITGGSPSAMRAFYMVLFYWSGRAFQRKSAAFSALMASALLALIINPFDLWNIGFQLSYVVVACILLYGLPLNEIINHCLDNEFHKRYKLLKNSLRWFFNLLGISLAANVGITFLSIAYFNTFAFGSIFLSIIIIPISSLIIIFGFVSLLMGYVGFDFISAIINPISLIIIRLMEKIIFISLKIPGIFWTSLIANRTIAYISVALLLIFLYGSHRLNQLKRNFFYLVPLGMISIFLALCYL